MKIEIAIALTFLFVLGTTVLQDSIPFFVVTVPIMVFVVVLSRSSNATGYVEREKVSEGK